MLRTLIISAALAFVALPVATPVFAADPECGTADLVKSAKLKIAACVDAADWQTGQGTGDQEFVYFSKDQTAGFAIVTETPTVTLDQYHDAILAFATKQSGAPDGSVTAYDEAKQDINGKTWQSMHYDVTVQGTKLEFLNYYYSEDGLGSTQFIFWSLPKDAATVKDTLASKVMSTATVTQ
jgi:hypothetical protein